MEKIIAIPDIHGNFNKLEQLTNAIQSNYKDFTIVFLGDMIDRGPSSNRVVRFVKDATEKGHKALLGNHEEMLFDYLEEKDDGYLSRYVGGRPTIQSFEIESGKVLQDPKHFKYYLQDQGLYEWMGSLPRCLLVDNLVFCHGIPGEQWVDEGGQMIPRYPEVTWGSPYPLNAMNKKQHYSDFMFSPPGLFCVCGHTVTPPDEDGQNRPLYVPDMGVYLDCGGDFTKSPLYAGVFENGILKEYINSNGEIIPQN